MKDRTMNATFWKLALTFLAFGLNFSSIAQTFSGELSQTCSAFSNREATFEGTPFVTEDVNIELEWVYCGPWNGNNNGHFYVDIWVDGSWQDLFDVTDSGNGCSWVSTSYTVSSSLWNAAISSNDGDVLIRGYITDSCSPGVGCNFFSDPCFRGAVEYDFEPIESAEADFSVTNESICVGEDLVITNLSSGTGLEYDWDFGQDVELVSVSEEQYVIRYTTEGTKTISLNANNILGDSNFSLEVTVNPTPILNLTNQMSICEGEVTTITATTTDPIEWNFGLGSNLSIDVNPTETTTYVATATNGFNCSTEASAEIEVLDLPNVNAGFDEAICFGESYSLSGIGDDSITWGIPGENNGEVDVEPMESTVYTLTAIGSNGCVASDDILITVNDLPEAFAGEDQTICEGESVELTAEGGETYFWEDLGSGATQMVSPSGSTTYLVTVTNGVNCSSVDQVTIDVNPSPEISVSENTTLCAGESIILEANSSGDIEWSQELGSEPIIEVTPIETTSYIATATNEFQCSVEAQVTVEVLPLPEVDAGEDISICIGESVVLSGIGEGSLYWGADEQSGDDITLSPTETATYQLTANGGNGCIAVDQITVNVNSLPVANAGMDQSICEGEDAQLLATGGTTYSWDNDLGSGDVQTVSPLESTIYVVTVTNAENCSDTDEVIITVNPTPEIEISDDVAICPGDVESITANGDGDVLWDNSPSSEETQEVSPDETTTYTALITNEFGCGSSASVTVTVYELEELSILGLSENAYCSVDENEYNMVGSPSGGMFSGNGVSGTQFSPSSAGLGATEIIYEYTDDNSCISAVSQIVFVEICSNVSENQFEVDFEVWLSNDQLFINSESDITSIQSIELFEIGGKKIWSELQSTENFPLVRDMSSLPSGIYVILLKGPGWVSSQSVLKR